MGVFASKYSPTASFANEVPDKLKPNPGTCQHTIHMESLCGSLKKNSCNRAVSDDQTQNVCDWDNTDRYCYVKKGLCAEGACGHVSKREYLGKPVCFDLDTLNVHHRLKNGTMPVNVPFKYLHFKGKMATLIRQRHLDTRRHLET